MVQVGGSTCQVCTMTPGWEHTVIQHEMAESLKGPLLDYIRDDAFTSDRERVLTYTGVVNRTTFRLQRARSGESSVSRAGQMDLSSSFLV